MGPGQVVCHGDIAARNTVFAGGRAVAFIDWDAIFVASPMWDLAHAVWQFAPVCGDADRWLDRWPGAPDRSARIAASVGGYGASSAGACLRQLTDAPRCRPLRPSPLQYTQQRARSTHRRRATCPDVRASRR